MPVVDFGVEEFWLPQGQDVQRPQIAEHHMTIQLAQSLPHWVADAVNAVDDSSLTSDEVIVNPFGIHPLAQNAPTYWINIQPSDVDGTWAEREQRRYAIADHVRDSITKFIARKATRRPSHDVECSPVSSSGMSTSPKGEVFQRWGVPDELPIPTGFDPEERTVVPKYHGD